MIEVREMSDKGIEELLSRVGYGHLACSLDDQPYVVPIHYAYDIRNIYVYTTEGKKSEIIEKNPHVCLQIEDVRDNKHWKSVIVTGIAKRLTDEKKRKTALQAIVDVNPTLTPAVSIQWMDNWVRENIEVIYSIRPVKITGREAVARK
jgi:uncharacterized protein